MTLYTGIAKGGPRDGQHMGFSSPVMQVSVLDHPLDMSDLPSIVEMNVDVTFKIGTYTLDEATNVWNWEC